jgi:hypothetical protein
MDGIEFRSRDLIMQAQNIIPSAKTALKDLPPKQQVRAMLEQNKSAIAKALPRHLGADRLLRVAQTACTTTPTLLECYTVGVLHALPFGGYYSMRHYGARA